VYVKSDGEEVRTEIQDYNIFVYDPQNSLGSVIDGDKPVIIKVPFW